MRKISLLIGYLISMYAGSAQKTYIWCGTLIDGKSDEAKKEMTIVVEKNRIVSVDKGYTNAGGGDSIINLKNKTVTPGSYLETDKPVFILFIDLGLCLTCIFYDHFRQIAGNTDKDNTLKFREAAFRIFKFSIFKFLIK